MVFFIIVIAIVRGQGLAILTWALLLLVVDLIVGRLLTGGDLGARRGEAFALVMVGAIVAGISLWINAATGPEAFMLMLVPAFRAGEAWGRRATFLVVLVSSAIGVAGWLTRQRADAAFVGYLVPWVGMALMVGVLGAWSTFLRQQNTPRPITPGAAREAALLMRRLDTLAESIDGGFDAPASAELMLDAMDSGVRSARRGVLVGFGSDPAVPFALRGAERTPWDEPTVDQSVLGMAWRSGESAMGLRTDRSGNERAVMAIVLRDNAGDRIGVVVLDRPATSPFSDAEFAAAGEIGEIHSANLDVALIFAALRERAGYEERERLAREMHDGIAQELVALGYRIDVLRRQAKEDAPDLSDSLKALREDLSGVLMDLRLRISDLRIAVRPDQGLGAIVGARIQRFGSSTGLAVVLRLNESGFRLPAHVETLIYRLILDTLADARHAPGATSVDLTLDVAAPQAFLRITHNGLSGLRQEDFADHPLTALGASIVVDSTATSGVALQMYLRQRRSPEQGPLITERIPQRS
ncbi:MAG TPA: histidine kinase [Candidatus Limnocylindrales bacterium]